ncbi:MAG TPA: sigma-54 dependent transcriptional regulator [Planctomycetaceae bacterium]|nr:sigma-54 dependent transcriptional regulator [Planctomycetaceae bacterium]HQZ69423.1 sigma-54 dependent transcriptional regulator [Planctomycetaceae bacterium]HRA87587.1 sigma-54 dependent transcriptional regulator [Planctomycetaceae bacterium]
MASNGAMNLLVVEDDPDFRETCTRWMTRKGHFVHAAANGHEALEACDRKVFDVAIVDMNMPGLSGLEVLDRMKASQVETEVIILTGQGSIESAVNAMKLGASDYLTKPFPLDELEQRCMMSWERARLNKENRALRTIIERSQPSVKIIGESFRMREVFRLIERVAPTDKPVLIQGESGTGKELVARALQQKSQRVNRPFVTINCAALPEQLVESELFGHRKGAFTGANEDRAGLFEVADSGTLFIDEIGELPGGLQPKLLRALEDGSIRRVGSHRERKVDVRVIAATNRILVDEVAAGRFREDLYYRINVMSLELPPLRKREGDVLLLIKSMLEKGWTITDEATHAMEAYSWPGNVRQLKNAIERAQILANDHLITIDDLPSEIVEPRECPQGPHVPMMNREKEFAELSNANGGQNADSPRLEDLEKTHIVSILRQQNGNKARTARILGIHRRKLYRLLERYGIGDETH